jgi:hypothetical protein
MKMWKRRIRERKAPPESGSRKPLVSLQDVKIPRDYNKISSYVYLRIGEQNIIYE